MKNKKIILILLIFSIFLFFGCTETAETQSTCSQLSGHICQSGESCYGQKLSASDSTNCCAVVCTKKAVDQDSLADNNPVEEVPDGGEGQETPVVEINLKEINLMASDFSDDFVLNDLVSGYQKNALEYQDGNQDRANEILTAGWQESYAVDYIRRSETQEIMGTKVILEEYLVSISKYDSTKSQTNYFKESIKNKEKTFLDNGYSLLSQKIGDNSVIGKAIESDDYTGLTRIAYAVYFTKGNLYVNFIAVGLERQIDDEKVIALAQKIAQRIV